MKKARNMKNSFVLIIIFTVLTACSKKENTNADALTIYKESMKIHDEIMPRMDEIFTLQQNIALQLDSLKKDSVGNASLIQKRRTAIHNLTLAEKVMMDWMHNIQDVPGNEDSNVHAHHNSHEQPSSSTPEEILNIQKAQKESIEIVKRDMEESIAKAKELLNKK